MKSAPGSHVCAPRFIAESVTTSGIRHDLSVYEQMNDEDRAEHTTWSIPHPGARSASWRTVCQGDVPAQEVNKTARSHTHRESTEPLTQEQGPRCQGQGGGSGRCWSEASFPGGLDDQRSDVRHDDHG